MEIQVYCVHQSKMKYQPLFIWYGKQKCDFQKIKQMPVSLQHSTTMTTSYGQNDSNETEPEKVKRSGYITINLFNSIVVLICINAYTHKQTHTGHYIYMVYCSILFYQVFPSIPYCAYAYI